MKTEAIVKSLTTEQQEKLINLDSLLKNKKFREKIKSSPVETLRSEGFDVPKDSKFVFTEDDTKIANDNGKDGIYYINLKNYESGYVDSEESKNLAGGISKEALIGVTASSTALMTAGIGALIYVSCAAITLSKNQLTNSQTENFFKQLGYTK